MPELLLMINEAAPFAMKFTAFFGVSAWILLSLIRRRPAPLPLILVSALYIGFLLHGTVVSRLTRWSDLLHWQMPDFSTVWWSFELSARTPITAMHASFNFVLFAPWGMLGMCYQRKPRMGLLVLLSGILASASIEFFQVCHGMSFDLGDLLTNSVGTAAGCIAGLPVTLFNGWMHDLKERKKPQRTRKRRR